MAAHLSVPAPLRPRSAFTLAVSPAVCRPRRNPKALVPVSVPANSL